MNAKLPKVGDFVRACIPGQRTVGPRFDRWASGHAAFLTQPFLVTSVDAGGAITLEHNLVTRSWVSRWKILPES